MLMNLPTAIGARDLQTTRRLYDEVQAKVRAESAFGRKTDKYGGQFLHLMSYKLTKEI